MIFKPVIVGDINIGDDNFLSLLAITKQEANKLKGNIATKVYTKGKYTAYLKVNIDQAKAVFTTESTRLAFTPRSGVIKDTPFYYDNVNLDANGNPPIEYQPAVVGTGWLPQGEDTDGTPKYGFVPYLRTEVFPTANGFENAVCYDKTAEAGSQYEFVGDLSNYGNLCWIDPLGLNGVSWKGSETRHFRNTSKKNAWDIFGNSLFLNGEVVPAPLYKDELVGGDFTHNMIISASVPDGLVIAITMHRDELAGRGNHFCIYTYSGSWVFVCKVGIGFSGTPWFADNTGLIFCHTSGATISVDIDAKTATLKEAEQYEGTQTEAYPPKSYPTFKKSYNSKLFHEYPRTDSSDEDSTISSGNVVSANMTITQDIYTDNKGKNDITYEEQQLVKLVNGLGCGYIIGPDVVSVGVMYELADSYCAKCSIEWSAPFSFDKYGSRITVTAAASCGTGTVTATVIGGDGATITKEVRLPLGTWVFEETIGTPTSVCNDYGMPFSTSLYAGTLKYIVGWYAGYTYNSSISSGVSITGTDDSGTSQSFPDTRPAVVAVGGCIGSGCPGDAYAYSGGWGCCDVCCDCGNQETAYAYRYAGWYSVYKWVCP